MLKNIMLRNNATHEKSINLLLSIFIALFFGMAILGYDFKAGILLGLAAFAFVFFTKIEYAFYFLLATRSVIDIFYSAEITADVKMTYLMSLLITVLFLFYFIASRYSIFSLKVNKIYGIFMFFSIFSVFFSQSLIYGLASWFKLLQGFLILNMTILLILKAGDEAYKKRINAISISAIIALLIPYILFFKNYLKGIYILRDGYIRYSLLGSYFNLFSYYLFAAFCFCLFLYSVTARKSRKIFWIIFMAVMLFTIYKTYTRNVWVGVAVIIFVWNLVRKNFKLALSVVGFIILMVIFNPVVRDRIKDLYILLSSKNFFNIDPKLLTHRIGVWQTNLRYFIYNSTWMEKLLGSGFDIKSIITASPLEHSMEEHNNYLTLLMNTGICGLSIYGLYILMLFRESFRLLKTAKDVYFRNLAQVFIAFLFAYVVTGFFTHMIWKINFQYYFSAFAGFIIAANILNKNNKI